MTDADDLYADLGAIAEIAGALGVSRERVHMWIARRDSNSCPAPLVVLTKAKLYSISEWKAWFAMWKVTRGTETWWPQRHEKRHF